MPGTERRRKITNVWVVKTRGSADAQVFAEHRLEDALKEIEWNQTLKDDGHLCEWGTGWYNIDDGGSVESVIVQE